MLMAPILNESNASNRLPYNSRQRLPSSSDSEENAPTDGPAVDEYRFSEAGHSDMVLKGLNDLRKSGQFCDVTLSVDGVKFPAHRNVLSSFSPYFKAMFLSKLAESKQSVVALKGIEKDMMALLLDYAYTSSLTITRGNVQCLLSAANLLQVMPVIEAACMFLEKHMDATNCLGIHCFAETHACTDLQKKAKDFALCNFWEVCHQEEFLSLTAAKLVELTRSDELEVRREEVVFDAVERWYNHKSETRKPEFAKVLETVRLPLLSPYYLHDCVEKMSVVKHTPDCYRLVEEAKLYHLLPDRKSEFSSPRTKPRNSADTIEVIVAVGGDEHINFRSVLCYCVKTRVWRSMNYFPFAVSKHGLVASGENNLLYLAGGELPDGSSSRSVWRYDPAWDLWLEMCSMLIPRSDLGLAMLDGCVYAVGGWEGSYILDSVERYDPATNSWSLIKPMKMAVTSPAVIAHKGMLYVTGGARLKDGEGIELVKRYDPRSDTWTELAPMLNPRVGAAICTIHSCIYVVGGWHASTENRNRVECYDVNKNLWTYKSPTCVRRDRPGIAVMDGKIYVLGGEEGRDRYHDSIECYDPKTDSWKMTDGYLICADSLISCVPLQVCVRGGWLPCARKSRRQGSSPAQNQQRPPPGKPQEPSEIIYC